MFNLQDFLVQVQKYVCILIKGTRIAQGKIDEKLSISIWERWERGGPEDLLQATDLLSVAVEPENWTEVNSFAPLLHMLHQCLQEQPMFFGKHRTPSCCYAH